MIITRKNNKVEGISVSEHKNYNFLLERICKHDLVYTDDFKLSDAGNLVVNRKCAICDKVLENFIFRPDVVEKYENGRWNTTVVDK